MEATDPRHGTYAGYVAHGKVDPAPCLPCATAARRFRKQARLEAHRGNPRTVELGADAYRILTTCTADQLSRRGVANATIFRLRKLGPETRVLRKTRDGILAARIPTPIGIQRRLRALTALGWSMRAFAAEMGNPHADNLRVLLARDEVNYVREPMAAAIVEAYERLAMQPAPDNRGSARARNRAKREGWAPPLAWDDIDTDERPRGVGWKPRVEGDRYRGHDYDETVVERILAGDYNTPSTPVEKTAVCARWVAMGRSLNELERRTGWRPSRYYKGDAA